MKIQAEEISTIREVLKQYIIRLEIALKADDNKYLLDAVTYLKVANANLRKYALSDE